jgi:uncharacterized protein with PIN domain
MNQLKTDPIRVEMEGNNLKCLLCSHELFHKRRTQVQVALPGGMSPEWHENAAYCLVCDHCGHVDWFIQK